MAQPDDVLRSYVEALTRRLEAGPEVPSRAELAAIARELGVSAADLEALDAAAQAGLERGRGYLRHALFDDAVRELTEVASLTPWDAAALVSLAEAHAGRFGTRRDPEDRDRASALARRALRIDPRAEAAFAVLNALGRRRQPVAGDVAAPGPGGPLRKMFWACFGLAAFGAIYIYGFRFNHMSETELVRWSGAWLYPLLFGAYGVVTDRRRAALGTKGAASVAEAVAMWFGTFTVLGVLGMWPYLLLPFFARILNPLAAAAAATAFWVFCIQFLFFEGLWHAL